MDCNMAITMITGSICFDQLHVNLVITAFTSSRTNLSPFTKGCREWDASM